MAYERHLTDTSGGNSSLRLEEGSFLASRTKNTKSTLVMEIDPEDLAVVDDEGNLVQGSGQLTSSWPTHSSVYSAFPGMTAAIHARLLCATVLAAALKPMTPCLDVMAKFGEIPILSGGHMVDGPVFAAEVVATPSRKQARRNRIGPGLLCPRHGVPVAGLRLEDPFDVPERIESTACALLFFRLVGDSDALGLERTQGNPTGSVSWRGKSRRGARAGCGAKRLGRVVRLGALTANRGRQVERGVRAGQRSPATGAARQFGGVTVDPWGPEISRCDTAKVSRASASSPRIQPEPYSSLPAIARTNAPGL